MTPQQRDAKSKEFQKKLEEFQKLAQASEEELLALREKETRALYESIEQAAVEHGKANAFAAIVVKKELLYVGSSVDVQDVTDPLIKSLNLTGQKK
jgi:outer membrane protein